MASTYLTRTPSSSGNRKTWTFSTWFKRSKIAAGQKIFCVQGDSSNLFECYFNSNDTLAFYHYSSNGGVTDSFLGTNQVFRDTSAWYHLVLAVDTTQGTASNRVKMYINGEQVTSFSSASYFNQNYDTYINWTYEHRIGANLSGALFFNGSMSHIHLIDGTAYTPSAFGSTDSTTGEWKINTSPSVTYGTNGFFILKDGNSVTDQSGNGNNWTVAGGTLTKTEDNPSNVFATLNPLATSTTSGSFSNGNTTHAKSNSTWASTTSTLAASSGKYYAEYKFTANSSSSNGQMAAIVNMDLTNYMNENSDLEQNGNKGITYYANGTVFADNQQTVATYSSYGDAIIQIAMDLDNGFLYFGKDGTWQNSGVPTSGSTGTGGINISNYIGAGTYAFGLANRNTGATSVNFGNGYFGTTAVSSAGTNASGNGIFEYDVPTGYTALSTKGLNQ